MTGIGNRNDGHLLAAFAEEGDEAAFAALVERHGKMVQSVCMRVLGEFHEAQDVTQAVFLTLARKAARLRKDSSVGGWLHRVATCLARDVRSAAQSRKRREEKSLQATESDTPAADDIRALREELDYAVEQLPAKYRQPLVLFHFEEYSLEDTALALGLKASAASARLVRAREMLRARLLRRGVALGSVGAVTAVLSAEAGAAVLPASVVSATVKAASLTAAGKLAAGVGTGVVSAKVVGLVKGACNMLFWSSVKTAAMVTATVMLVGGAGVGTFLAAQTRPIAGSSPATVPASQSLPMPKPRSIGEILSGTIVAIDGNKFVLALDEPWQGQKQITFWTTGRTDVAMDGVASTWADAVKPGRRATAVHIRGATP